MSADYDDYQLKWSGPKLRLLLTQRNHNFFLLAIYTSHALNFLYVFHFFFLVSASFYFVRYPFERRNFIGTSFFVGLSGPQQKCCKFIEFSWMLDDVK